MISFIIYSCKKGISAPDSSSIEFKSYNNIGCIKGEIGRVDVAKVETIYINGELEVDLIFTTLCSAKMKDSVVIEGKKIDIFLKDVNLNGSRCGCLFKEVFIFAVNGMKEIEIKFNYDAYAREGYDVLADTTIQLK